MQRKRLWKIFALVTAGLALTGFVSAKRYHGAWSTPEGRVAKVQEIVADKLELTDAQKAKLDDVGKEALAMMQAFHEQRDQDADTFIAQIETQLDRDAILGAFDKRKSLAEERLPGLVDKLVTFHASLTPEQKKQVADFLKERRQEKRG